MRVGDMYSVCVVVCNMAMYVDIPAQGLCYWSSRRYVTCRRGIRRMHAMFDGRRSHQMRGARVGSAVA